MHKRIELASSTDLCKYFVLFFYFTIFGDILATCFSVPLSHTVDYHSMGSTADWGMGSDNVLHIPRSARTGMILHEVDRSTT